MKPTMSVFYILSTPFSPVAAHIVRFMGFVCTDED
jgi:hypothetical protein